MLPLIYIFQAAELGRLYVSMNKLEKDLKDLDKYKVFYYFYGGVRLCNWWGCSNFSISFSHVFLVHFGNAE